MTSSNNNGQSTGLFWILVTLALIFGGLLRFHYLNRIGFRGDDTLFYISLIRGEAEPTYRPFRVFVLWVYQFADNLLPFLDWSIKAFNAFSDWLNILLIGCIAYAIERNKHVAAMVALSYALSLRAIAFARTELFHTFETTMLLTAVLMFLMALKMGHSNKRLLLLCLVGIVIGLSFGVHEESILVFPALAIFLLLYDFPLSIKGGNQSWWGPVRSLGLMSVPFLVTISLLGFWVVMTKHMGDIGTGAGYDLDTVGMLTFYFEIYRAAVLINNSWIFFIAFNLALLASASLIAVKLVFQNTNAKAVYTGDRLDLRLLPLLIIFVDLLTYPLVSTYIFPRLFLSLTPLLILLFFSWVKYIFSQMLSSQQTGVLLVLFTAVIAWGNYLNNFSNPQQLIAALPEAYPGLYRVYTPATVPMTLRGRLYLHDYPISNYRQIYDVIHEKIDSDNRLLIAPHMVSAYPGRRGFELYFGNNAKYLSDCKDSIGEYVRNNNIRYLIMVSFHYKHDQPAAPCLGMDEANYSLQKELKILPSKINQQGFRGTVIYQGQDFSIWRLEDIN